MKKQILAVKMPNKIAPDKTSIPRHLRIVMVTDVYDDMKNGAAISMERFVSILKKKHSVKIVSTGKTSDDKIVVPSFYFPLVKPIMIKMKFSFAWPDEELLVKAFSEADIVHIQFPFYLGMKAVKIARRMHVPVISAFHVQPENICYNIGIKTEWVVNLLYKLFIRKVFNRTEAVICPSPFAENELKRRGLTPPSHVVSNGVMPQFKPIKVKRPAEFNNRFVILSVGRLAKDKRQDVLIHAINKSKYRDSIQLVITGEGPIKEKLVELGKLLPNKPFFWYLPVDELIRLYNSADLYVHPSAVELESMSVLEAIACGLPALISDSNHSASKQFAINDRFLFKSNNAADLTGKIDYWVEHQKELYVFKRKYHQLSRSYSMEESIRKVEHIYYAHAR